MDNALPWASDRRGQPRPAKWKVTLVIGGIVAIQIGNYIATATIGALLAHHPMYLLLLQPTTKNLLLVATQIPLVTFFVVAVIRRQVPHPLWFFIGRWYGKSGIAWVKRYSPDTAAILDLIEDKFPRYGWLICMIYPNPVICAMAGASEMRFIPFLIYTFTGIIGYVWASRLFGDFLSPVTHWITDFARHYTIPITILTVVIVLFGIWQGVRNGSPKFESIEQIENELEGGDDVKE
jgi:membrane protein DedA with SNARE-associated domain